MANQPYTFSFENETSANQVAPAPQYAQPGTQYGMAGQQPVVGQPVMGQPMMGQPMMGQPMMGQPMMGQPMMSQNVMMMAARAAYPYSSPHFYDDKGRVKLGIVKWTPQPGEDAYRPFYTVRAKRGIGCVAIVDALDEEELQTEIQSVGKKSCCHVFCCCFICGLQAAKHAKKCKEYKSKGNDTEARNSLLDAKIKLYQSLIGGAILWSIFIGATHIAVLPFVGILYLIMIVI